MPASRRLCGSVRAAFILSSLLLANGCGGGDPPVQPPPVPGTVAVTATPSSFSAAIGSTSSAGLTISRGSGFAGDVVLTASGVPAGMTIAFTPATVGAAIVSSSVSATVGAAVAVGVDTVTVVATATADNQIRGSTSLIITVTPAVSSTVVTQSYCAADAPIWVAFQDGSGPWTRIVAGANNTYTFQLTSAHGGIATVDTVGPGFDVNVFYGTAAEFASYDGAAAAGGCGAKTLTGTVANVSSGQFANVSVGNATTFTTGASFSLTRVPAGLQDLFAARVNSTTRRVDRMILRRAQNIPVGGTIPVFDFGAAEAFASASANLTVTGLTTDTAFFALVYNGTRGAAFGYQTANVRYTAASGAVPYDAIPGTSLNAGELQQMFAGTSTPSSTRFAGVFFRAPVDRTLALAPYLSTPTVTRSTDAPYTRPRTQVDLQTEYNRMLLVDFAQTALNRSASLSATRAWAGGASWDVTFPDLSTAAGWTTSWALQPGTPFTWTVAALGGAIYQLDPTVADGASFRSARINSLQPVP
jgi:hypothetical protein